MTTVWHTIVTEQGTLCITMDLLMQTSLWKSRFYTNVHVLDLNTLYFFLSHGNYHTQISWLQSGAQLQNRPRHSLHHHGLADANIPLRIRFLDKCPPFGPENIIKFPCFKGIKFLIFGKSPSFGQFWCFMDLKHENPLSDWIQWL